MSILKRDLNQLKSSYYDLIIVGGGIFGACAAWDAALRGLSVAIVEKKDFSHATSANHFKMVHGGIRYLQHADIYRIRESCRERSAFLRIAPHLVYPLPIIIPTYGHGTKGKEFLGAGMFIYDCLTCGRNNGIQKERRIPKGRFISRSEVIKFFPGIKEKGLTGGVIFCDGQIYNSPRLALSFLRSAVNKGAHAANYVEVTGFLQNGSRITGIQATDALDGSCFEIKGKVVLNTAGPWAHRLLELGLGLTVKPKPVFSRDLAFIINRKPTNKYGIAISTKVKDADSIVDTGGRRLFLAPWKGQYTLVGVWHTVFGEPPEKISVTPEELKEYIRELNEAYPGLAVSYNDIMMVNTGLTLYGEEENQGTEIMSFGKRSRLVNHSKTDDLEGLVTLIGVRATTARGMAEKAIDIILGKLGKNIGKSYTNTIPIYGGDMASFEELLNHANRQRPKELSAENIRSLVHNYGSQYHMVLKYAEDDHELIKFLGDTSVLKAEVIYAIREEMAHSLADIVFRRTDLASGQYPEKDAINSCADLMASELGWNLDKRNIEIKALGKTFPNLSKGFGIGCKQ